MSISDQSHMPILRWCAVFLQEHDGFLRLHLPALEKAIILATRLASGLLFVDQDSFRSAANLTFLDFAGVTLCFLPDSFTGLPALSMLSMQCELLSIPPALTVLAGSLTHLTLAYNDSLQLADDNVSILLALGKLRTLDLQKSRSVRTKSCPGSNFHIAMVPAQPAAPCGAPCSLPRAARS